MPTVQQQREKLVSLLKELFQLDQPDLDFGFYRIMHAKAKQVTAFLENDLLKIVEQTFGQASGEKLAALQKAYEDAIAQAKSFGAAQPEQTDPVKKAKATLEAAKDTSRTEGEVYDHLYRFFERYYEGGDFMSRRYLSRETSTKAAPYAVPHDGSELYLHWANKDQHYIKTAEYFANFTFDPTKAPEVEAQKVTLFPNAQAPQMRVHCRVVAATEGAHGNIKPRDDARRYFLLHAAEPVAIDEGGLVCRFEYRPDPDKTGQELTWQAKRNDQAVAGILDALTKLADPQAKEYLAVLKTAAPTEKQKDRPILARYVNQYTARNTTDYFIHRDLGGFLRRELDFYIKNEVMRLDDIESADAPKAEAYLDQLRCLRHIAGKIVAFLAQLEEFQKSLWLKRKFVTDTHYCITLDRIPVSLYQDIAASEAQREEWVRLFAIDRIKADLNSPGYSAPLKVEFLKAHRHLSVDTRLHSAGLRDCILAAQANLEEATNGVLVHAENLQALRLLGRRYREQIQCVHIDPPYNTQTSGFLYRNSYQHSSWLAMMAERTIAALPFLTRDGSYLCHIDENEYERLHLLFDELAMPNGGTVVWDKRNPMLGRKGVATQHEYLMWRTFVPGPVYLRNATLRAIVEKATAIVKKHGGVTKEAREEFSKWIGAHPGLSGGERAYRLLNDDGRVYQSVGMAAPEPRTDPKFHEPLIHPVTKKPCPVPSNGWSRAPDTLKELIAQDEIIFGDDESTQPRRKVFLTEDSQRQVSSVIQETGRGKADVEKLGLEFPYCHPLPLYVELVGAGAPSSNAIVLDFFAGSGTNGHATIAVNREDGTARRYVLVEVGDHFDTVLRPRILKAAYSKDWKDGKPESHATGISHVVRYFRLESYEDCLNSLELKDDAERKKQLEQSPGLRADYMLYYMLDVETAGSASLLNIDQFKDPTAYKLKVKKPGSDEYDWKNVDLLETFNYLLGLRVEHIAAPQTFAAEFAREVDPDLPKGQLGRLKIKGKLKQAAEDAGGKWWFRKVEGWVPKNPATPNDGQREKVLIVWRKLTGDLEQDNLVLDEWFRKYQINPRESYDYDTIYVNGSNNLPNLKLEKESWRVRLIEEDFHRLMWDTDEA